MKSEKNYHSPVSYPCLKEYHLDDNNFIVLFEKEGYGTIVWSNSKNYSLGRNQCWIEENFKTYYGTVKLMND